VKALLRSQTPKITFETKLENEAFAQIDLRRKGAPQFSLMKYMNRQIYPYQFQQMTTIPIYASFSNPFDLPFSLLQLELLKSEEDSAEIVDALQVRKTNHNENKKNMEEDRRKGTKILERCSVGETLAELPPRLDKHPRVSRR
jgi:hypothetical protein